MTTIDFLKNVTGGKILPGLKNVRESIATCAFGGYPVAIGLEQSLEAVLAAIEQTKRDLAGFEARLLELDFQESLKRPKP